VARLKTSIVLAGALSAVAAGPGAFAAWLARPAHVGASLPPAVVLGLAGQVPPGAAAYRDTPAVLGTLFGDGNVVVQRTNGDFSISGETYAYPGLETVRVGEGGLGTMRITGAGSVFWCAGAAGKVSRSPDGALTFSLESGTARLVFESGAVPAIRAGKKTFIGEPGLAGEQWAAEVSVVDDTVLVISVKGLVKDLVDDVVQDLPADSAASSAGWAATAGDETVWSVNNAAPGPVLRGEATAFALPVGASPSPDALTGPADASNGGDRLCQLAALGEVGRPLLVGNQSPTVPVSTGAEDQVQRVPAELTAPGAPALALVEPRLQDTFDPNLLPAPAAGPGEDTQIVVPVPALPVLGAGGGGLASPD
jgi:hypothetical protein